MFVCYKRQVKIGSCTPKIFMDAYKKTRNRVNRLNKDLKRYYFTNEIALSQCDLKNTWKTINMVLNKKSKTTQI